MNDKDLNINNNTLNVEDASLFLENFKKFVKFTELCKTNNDGNSYKLDILDENTKKELTAFISENGDKLSGNTFMKKMFAVIKCIEEYKLTLALYNKIVK